MNRALWIAALVVSSGMSTGCVTGRFITSMEENSQKNATLLRTHDHYTYLPFIWGKDVDQFWQCGQQGTTLTCTKACDGNTDLTCPIGFSTSDVGRGQGVK